MKHGLLPFIGPRSYVFGEQEAHVYLCEKESVPMWKALLNADTILRVIVDDSILKMKKYAALRNIQDLQNIFSLNLLPKKTSVYVMRNLR